MNYENIYEELKLKLKTMVKSERFDHVMSVENFADDLIKAHNINNIEIIKSIKIAIISHDMFRDFNKDMILKKANEYGISQNDIEKKSPILLHGKIAAEYIKEKFNINSSIYKAVYFHTSGNINYGIVGKILIISDTLEKNRDFKGVDELRKISFQNLNKGYFEVIKNRIDYALSKNLPILNETFILYNKLRGE